jgi:glycosyltransferase involved in cell wall biosynthesis
MAKLRGMDCAMQVTMSPKISIVISCYNRPAETCQAITAIREQDFTAWELIVVDNGCTDNSLEMLMGIAAEEPRMRVIPLKRSQVAVARMTGIRATHPESGYVVVHDDDDWLFPGALTKLWALALANPDAAGVYGMPLHCDDNGNSDEILSKCYGSRRVGVSDTGKIVDIPEDAPDTFGSMVVWCWIATMGQVLIRRDVLLSSCGFVQAYGISDDWNMWLDITRTNHFVRLFEFTLYKRTNGTNLSGNKALRAVSERAIRQRLRADGTMTPAQQRIAKIGYFASCILFLRSAAKNLRHKNVREALMQTIRALRRVVRICALYTGPIPAVPDATTAYTIPEKSPMLGIK